MNFKFDKMVSVSLNIDARMAEAMLATNDKNRKLDKSRVSIYADAMKRGEWMLTSQGISFDVEGKLIDGQHRLRAVIEAGVTVPMRVTYGVPSETFAVIDTGKKRTLADALLLSDMPGRSSRAVQALKKIVTDESKGDFARKLQNSDWLEIAKRNTHLLRVIEEFSKLGSSGMNHARTKQLSVAEISVIAICMIATCDVENAKMFYRTYRFGEIRNDRNCQIVFSLKSLIIKDWKDERKRIMNAFKNYATNTDVKTCKSTSYPVYSIDVQSLINGDYDPLFDGIAEES